MLRVLLCTLFVVEVAYAWGWDWNRHWNKPCRYLNHINCDYGYGLELDAYYKRDGDRHGHDNDNDWNRRHGHDNDNDWNRRHGHDNDNDWNHRHGHDNDNDWNHRHGHDNDNDWNHRHGHDNDNDWNHRHGHDNDNDWDHRHNNHIVGRDVYYGRHDWYGRTKICGTDGVTYKNRCYFRKAQCQTNTIAMRHEGACKVVVTDAPTPKPKPVTEAPTTMAPTTMAPTTMAPMTTQAPVVDEFCQNIIGTICHGVSPICGTNEESYDNECEFEKAKCLDPTLHVRHLGTCE